MIREVTNIMMLPRVIKMSELLYHRPAEFFKQALITAITEQTSKILIFQKEDDIRGFIFATVEEFDGEDVAFIHSCFIDPRHPKVGKQMLANIRNWAKELGLKNVMMLTQRNPKGFIKKYKFEFCSYVLKKGVDDVKHIQEKAHVG